MSDSPKNIDLNLKGNINNKQFKIMVFLMNALEKGWTIKTFLSYNNFVHGSLL